MFFREFLVLIKYLTQPDEGETILHYKSRMVLTVLLLSVIAIFTAHFVYAAQNFADKRDLETLMISDLDEKIINTAERQCRAIESDNEDAKRFALSRLNDLKNKYRLLTGRDYPVPQCEAL